ncbi:2-hydroxy-1,4-benzoquinone reductase-like [Littorina saxatilis]
MIRHWLVHNWFHHILVTVGILAVFGAYKVTLQRMGSQAGEVLKLLVVMSTTREGRMGSRVVKFIQNELGAKYDITILDPKELDLPLVRMPIHHYDDRTQAPKVLLDIEAKLKAAEAFLFVTAEYNGSVPPALSSLLDHFPPGHTLFGYKPSGIVSYSMGSFGGMMGTVPLRQLLNAMGTVAVPESVHVPQVHSSLDEDGKVQGNDHLKSGLESLDTQLGWYAHSMKEYRKIHGVPKL